MKSFDKIHYLGGLPYPFHESCKLSILADHNRRTLFFTKGNSTMGIPGSAIIQVTPDIQKDRSLGKGAIGYAVGNWILNQNAGIIGAAIGARRKDVSMLYIDYQWQGRQGRIVLKAGKKAWDLYAGIQALIY